MTHKLELARRKQGFSRADLAELTDLSLATISNIETGRTGHRVNHDVANNLAKALGLKLTDLFGPGDVSHLGRPPHTGCTKVKLPIEITITHTCENCHLTLPATGECDNCS